MMASQRTAEGFETELRHFNGYSKEPFTEQREVLAYARGRCPVSRSDAQGGFWLVTRYADVRRVLQDAETFSSVNGLAIPRNPNAPAIPPIDADPPIQTQYRTIINRFLSRSGVSRYAEEIRELARELVAKFAARGQCDWAAEFAELLPMRVLARVLYGIDDEEELLALKKAIAPISEDNTSAGADEAWRQLQAFMERVTQRRADVAGPDDLVAAVMSGRVEDRPLTSAEQVGMLGVLLLAGLKTTTHLITSVVHRLCADPAVEPRLREPDWNTKYLEELIRVSPVVAWVGRTVVRPARIGEVDLSPGDMVMCHLGSADLDEDEFDQAEAVDLDRRRNRHLGFGVGPHRCIGSNLARLQVQIAVEELLAVGTGFRLQAREDALVFRAGVTFGPKALHIEFSPIARPGLMNPESAAS
jgi:cytochrome P450